MVLLASNHSCVDFLGSLKAFIVTFLGSLQAVLVLGLPIGSLIIELMNRIDSLPVVD